jgi:hypothetical protein
LQIAEGVVGGRQRSEYAALLMANVHGIASLETSGHLTGGGGTPTPIGSSTSSSASSPPPSNRREPLALCMLTYIDSRTRSGQMP